MDQGGVDASTKRPLLAESSFDEESRCLPSIAVPRRTLAQEAESERQGLLRNDEPQDTSHPTEEQNASNVSPAVAVSSAPQALSQQRPHSVAPGSTLPKNAAAEPESFEMQRVPSAASASSPSKAGSPRDLPPPGSEVEMRDAQAQACPAGMERQCFICLGDGDAENPLIACCSTCYASTHVKCWNEWRISQRHTALRSSLLGQRVQTDSLLRCTICKSGTALVVGEESGLAWMQQHEGGSTDEGLGGITGVGGSSEDDDERQLENVINNKMCTMSFLCVNLLVFLLVAAVATLLISVKHLAAGDVIFCCIIGLFELGVLQVVLQVIMQRRNSIIVASTMRRRLEDEDLHTNAAREPAIVESQNV